MKDELIEALLSIKKGHIVSRYDGICCNLYLSLARFRPYVFVNFVSENCQDWEFFSGDSRYPVGGEAEYLYHYDCYCDFWVDESLELRMHLIDHLVRKLKTGTADLSMFEGYDE